MNQDTACAIEVLSNVLTLRKILRCLNARQLNACSRVCKLWNSEAKKEKKARHQVHWDTFILSEEQEEPGGKTVWWSLVNSFILDSPVEPVSALIFCTDSLCSELDNDVETNGGRRKKKTKTSDGSYFLLPSALPSACKVHISVTDGIIGTDRGMKSTEYDEYEAALTIVLFGGHWNFRLQPFACSHEHCQTMLKYWSGTSNEIPPCLASLRNDEVKMFNLFCPLNGVDQEIGYSLFRMFNWPLVAGGNVSFRFLKDGHESWLGNSGDCRMSGVAISGQNVEVASVIIRDFVDTVEAVDACIKELAEHNFPLDCSLGLMYACVGRGSHVYDGKRNVESTVFRKYFPNTPLFGFFGNGEIGSCFPQPDPLHVPSKRKHESLSRESSSSNDPDSEEVSESEGLSRAQIKRQIEEKKIKDREFKMKHPPKLMHAYTTIMCLISIQRER